MIPLKTPSGRRPGCEVFVLGYMLESNVRPLHRVYVSVTILYLACLLNSGYLGFGCPRAVFLLTEFPLR
jgi:hypothetical protein